VLTCASFHYTTKTLYGRAFININITQLHKPMTSQFDDRLIISNGKTITGLKKFKFPNPSYVCYFNSSILCYYHKLVENIISDLTTMMIIPLSFVLHSLFRNLTHFKSHYVSCKVSRNYWTPWL